MSSGSGGRSRKLASPLSWTSFDGVKDVEDSRFQARLDELFLQYPNSEIAQKAMAKHISEVKAFVQGAIKTGPGNAPLGAPSFPVAGKSETVAPDTIPTYAYNWCVSPMTPMGVAGVIWVPSESNLSEKPEHYAAELEIYARSLSKTYGLEPVPFYFAQPEGALVERLTMPKIPGAKSVTFSEWPESLKAIAVQLAGEVEP